jgi:signal transduction histidine kinase
MNLSEKHEYHLHHSTCPATSLSVVSIDEFTEYEFTGGFKSTLKKIGDNIVYLEIIGNFAYYNDEVYRSFYDRFLEAAQVKEPHIQIRDLLKQTGEIPIKQIIKNINYNIANQHRIAGVVFIGVTKWLKLLINSGAKFFPHSTKYITAADYLEALLAAQELNNNKTHSDHLNFQLDHVIFQDEWEYHNPTTGFIARLGVIPHKLLYITTEGNATELKDLNQYLSLIDRVVKTMQFRKDNYYVIVDISNLKEGIPLNNKFFFANKLRQIEKENQFFPRHTILCGANFFYRTSFKLFTTFLKQRFVFADHTEQAFQKFNTLSQNTVLKIKKKKPVTINQQNIDEIIDLCGSMIWDHELNIPNNSIVSENNPLKPIGESLEVVKNDIAGLVSNYLAILGDINCGIVVSDTVTKEILFVNNAALKILNISREKILGGKCFNFLCMGTSMHCSNTHSCKPNHVEEFVIDADTPSEKYISLTMSENFFENKSCYIHSFNDITDIKKGQLENEKHLKELQKSKEMLLKMMKEAEDANRKMRQSEENLSTLFASMTEMVVMHELVLDEKGNPINYIITDCNKAFTDITGIARMDAIGKLATQVFKVNEAPFLEIYSQVAITGQPYEYTIYYPPLDKHLAISAVSPGKNKFATVTNDITGVKQVQELITAKNKELENYLYVASHDLRTPLINIHGFSQRLHALMQTVKGHISEIPDPTPKKAEMLNIMDEKIPRTLGFIDTNVDKMDKLINGLLQISRTGSMAMKIREININNLLALIIEANEFQIQQLKASISADNLAPCYGDENLLNQLFSNLIGNALKYYHPDRSPVIEIHSQKHFNKVTYSIKDNGRGISERNLLRIWDVFFRANPDEKLKGEGIGLSIVKRIADKHKGKVWASSTEGEGSTFYVELQCVEFSE